MNQKSMYIIPGSANAIQKIKQKKEGGNVWGRENMVFYIRQSEIVLLIRLQKRPEGNEGVSMQITGEEACQQGKHQTEKSLAWDVLETTKAVAEEQ